MRTDRKVHRNHSNHMKSNFTECLRGIPTEVRREYKYVLSTKSLCVALRATLSGSVVMDFKYADVRNVQ